MHVLLRKAVGLVRAAARVVLGLFVIWQLVFLFAANLLEAARETRDKLPAGAAAAVDRAAPGWNQGEGRAYEVVEAVTTVTRRWAQLTAQPQDWALFAPNVRGDSVFPAVELHWDEDSRGADRSMPRAAELLLSDNEPADPHHFLRVGRFRLRRYEGSLAVMLTAYEEETPDETKARWRERIERFLRKDWDAVRAYLRWRMRTWAERHPDRPPPRQAVLLMRRYQIPGPDEAGPFDWGGPYTEPVARWGPDTTWPGGHLPVEMYNPVTGRFQWLRYRGGG